MNISKTQHGDIKMTPEMQASLRKPFEPHQISTFPRNAGSKAGLSYVGHAALTDRLLQADPNWTWNPVANPQALGLPMVGSGIEMWIALTIGGVTRYGYGDAQDKKGGNAVKEAIGDALRNAAMRFGVALDLWHKGGDLYDAGAGAVAPEPEKQETITKGQADSLRAELANGGSDESKFVAWLARSLKVGCIEEIPLKAFADVMATAKKATATKAAAAAKAKEEITHTLGGE
jgi:hypothetical protein